MHREKISSISSLPERILPKTHYKIPPGRNITAVQEQYVKYLSTEYHEFYSCPPESCTKQQIHAKDFFFFLNVRKKKLVLMARLKRI